MKDKTLNELLTDGVSRFTKSDKPQKIIDEAVKSLFSRLIEDAFGSYGDFGRQMKELINKALPQNIEKIAELPKYNKLIIDSLRNEWNTSGVEKQFIDQTTEAMKKFLNKDKVPDVIFLSDLLNEFMAENEEQAMEEGWEKPSLIIDEKEDHLIGHSKTCHIYFDKEPQNPYSYSHSYSIQQQSKYQLENNIAGHFTEKTIEVDGFQYPIYKIYSARFEGMHMSKLLKHNCSKFESMMIALYCGSSTLALDCQADDIYYPNHYD